MTSESGNAARKAVYSSSGGDSAIVGGSVVHAAGALIAASCQPEILHLSLRRYEAAILSEPPSTALGIGRGRRRIGDSPVLQPEAGMSLQLFAAALLGFGAVTPALGRDDSQVPLPNYADFCPDYALYSTYPQFVPAHMSLL